MTGDAIVIAGVLSKKGIPDVRLELRRISPSDFEVVENGRPVSVFCKTVIALNKHEPDVTQSGAPPGLREAWEKCVAQCYRGYKVMDLEEETIPEIATIRPHL